MEDVLRHYFRQQERFSQPKIEERTEDKLKERKAKQEHYYNRGTRELTELQPGDTVRMKPLPTDRQKLWKKGVVVKQVAPRSYEVDLQGSVYRRNRRHLVKIKESPSQPEPELSQPIREFQSAVKEQNRLGSPVKEASFFVTLTHSEDTSLTCNTYQIWPKYSSTAEIAGLCLGLKNIQGLLNL